MFNYMYQTWFSMNGEWPKTYMHTQFTSFHWQYIFLKIKYIYMCVCVYVCVYRYIHTYIHTYTYTHTHTQNCGVNKPYKMYYSRNSFLIKPVPT